MDLISHTANRINPLTRFTRYRGDGWQIYLQNPGLGLTTTLLFVSELRARGGLESRIALGLGSAYVENEKSLGTASGSAFIASGRALDDLRPPRRLVLAGEGTDKLHLRLIAMIDRQTATWSPEQAEVIAMALAPEGAPTQSIMAERLGISRQAVAARLQAAGFDQINGAANDFLDHFGHKGDPDD
ncbi:hypothetical protein [Tabrizicola sp.]|uniref:hypothetical protein n=1 Tax=Tabrizicola sp. TaxID=2005166 RepID=UPI003F2D301F